jgi:hypothetical protein
VRRRVNITLHPNAYRHATGTLPCGERDSPETFPEPDATVCPNQLLFNDFLLFRDGDFVFSLSFSLSFSLIEGKSTPF